MAAEHVQTRLRGAAARSGLQARAAARVRSFGGRPPSRFRCADPSGTIRVTVGAGDRVIDVELDPGWRDRFGPEYFATALLAAYREALHQSRYVRGLVLLAGGEPAASGHPAGSDAGDTVVPSPAGYLRLVRRGRAIRTVHVDTRRICSAVPSELCADVLAVFRRALG